MVSPAQIRATVERYVKLLNEGDADGVTALYAEDGTVEDPVGGAIQRGREAVRAWYARSAGRVRLELSGPIRVAGDEAAFPMLGTLGPPGARSQIDIIDVLRFDEAGRIASMRAFWSADAIRKL